MKCPECGSENTVKIAGREEVDCRDCIARREQQVKRESLERKRRYDEPPEYINWSLSNDAAYEVPVRVAINGGRYVTGD